MSSIRVLTFNVSRNIDVLSHLSQVVKRCGVSIVTLQGCTRTTGEKVIREMISCGLKYSRLDESHMKDSIEYVFSSFPIVSKKYVLIDRTKQDRGFSVYVINTAETKNCPERLVTVLTSQFDSGGGGSVARKFAVEQLEVLANVNIPVIFAGDTNIPYWSDLQPVSLMDAWREVGDASGDTTFGNDRPDRLWYKNTKCVKCVGVDMLCSRKAVLGEFVV